MRPRRPLAVLAVAAVMVVAACDSGDDRGLPPIEAASPVPVEPARTQATAPLCDALPGDVVAEATGRSPVTVDGVGTQCSWRAGPAGADMSDVVLQGSFIDARSFEVGRRDAAAAVPGLGDAAYVVRAGDSATATLYVLDGSRAFALWLGDPGAADAEATLARLAHRVLAS